MDICVMGLSHKTAPLELREKAALREVDIPDFLCAVSALPGVSEAAVLSTCNRVEVWCAVEKEEGHLDSLLRLFEREKKVAASALASHCYHYRLPESAAHLFRVASSLDSMVVGEPQILGQVKRSYELAQATGTVGKLLSEAFQKAFSVAKRVRTETEIARNPVSIPTAAIHLAEKILGDLHVRKVLVIGAGKIGTLTASALASRGVTRALFLNRNLARAERLAARFSGEAVPFESLPSLLREIQIVITSTQAPHHILRKEDLEKAMKARHGLPLFIVDLAVPRNVDPESASIDDLYLYDIDALEEVVEEHIQLRQEEVQRCEGIIGEGLGKFMAWVGGLEAEPLIRELNREWDRIRDEEVQKALAKLTSLSEEERKQVEILASRLIRRLRHPPLRAMKENPGRMNGESIGDYLRRLLGLRYPR